MNYLGLGHTGREGCITQYSELHALTLVHKKKS